MLLMLQKRRVLLRIAAIAVWHESDGNENGIKK